MAIGESQFQLVTFELGEELYGIDIMDVKEIVEIFENSNYFNLPVVDEGKYIGFVSRAKVFTTYREMLKKFSDDE